METTVFKIEFNDGRTFNIFCANKTQKTKIIQSYYRDKENIKSIEDIVNGIHTPKQYLKILETIEPWKSY